MTRLWSAVASISMFLPCGSARARDARQGEREAKLHLEEAQRHFAVGEFERRAPSTNWRRKRDRIWRCSMTPRKRYGLRTSRRADLDDAPAGLHAAITDRDATTANRTSTVE